MHRHLRAKRQDLAQRARLVGVQVKDDNISQPQIVRYLTEQALQRRHTARRGPDRTDGDKLLCGQGFVESVVHRTIIGLY
jgi:hypothetical protein